MEPSLKKIDILIFIRPIIFDSVHIKYFTTLYQLHNFADHVEHLTLTCSFLLRISWKYSDTQHHNTINQAKVSDFSKQSSGISSFRTVNTTLSATRKDILSYYKNIIKMLIKI